MNREGERVTEDMNEGRTMEHMREGDCKGKDKRGRR